MTWPTLSRVRDDVSVASARGRSRPDPTEIPNGYDPDQHRRLSNTIARVDEVSLDIGALRAMACHESPIGRERPCIGWLHNQLTDGNNVLVRYLVRLGRFGGSDYVLDGEQHLRFEDTLPKKA